MACNGLKKCFLEECVNTGKCFEDECVDFYEDLTVQPVVITDELRRIFKFRQPPILPQKKVKVKPEEQKYNWSKKLPKKFPYVI